jgi:hypothetical protein
MRIEKAISRRHTNTAAWNIVPDRRSAHLKEPGISFSKYVQERPAALFVHCVTRIDAATSSSIEIATFEPGLKRATISALPFIKASVKDAFSHANSIRFGSLS